MEFDPDEYSDAAEEVLNSVQDDYVQDEVDNASETEVALTAAMQRIEEANLWKVLIKQDVFEHGSARDEILQAANRKIKKFALNELNKLLNIGQPEIAAKPVEVKLPFDNDEVLALKVLASHALRKGMVSGVKEEERTPKVAAVNVPQEVPVAPKPPPEPSIRRVASPNAPKPQPQQQKSPVKAAQPPKKTRKGGRNTQDGRGAGYALPTTKPIPMPTADQLLGMQLPTAQVTIKDVTDRELKAANPQELVSAVVSQLTGGQLVSQHNTLSEEDDINGRL